MPQFNQTKVRSSLAAALFAVVLSTVAVTSAVGPARAAENIPAVGSVA